MTKCSCSLTIKKDDVLVEEYTAADYDAGAEYVVDFIVAEKTKGKKMQYLVKWKVINVLQIIDFASCLAVCQKQIAAYKCLAAYMVLLIHLTGLHPKPCIQEATLAVHLHSQISMITMNSPSSIVVLVCMLGI